VGNYRKTQRDDEKYRVSRNFARREDQEASLTKTGRDSRVFSTDNKEEKKHY
jgi:hypothetical protein